MRYLVTYSRTPLQLPDGTWTTDSYLVQDRTAVPADIASAYATHAEATIAVLVLNSE